MSFGDVLNSIGGGVLSAWDGIVSAATALWHGIDYVLQFVMPWLFAIFNPVCNWLGDLVYAAFAPFPPWVGLTVISIVTGVVMLIAFRYMSDQDAISRVKDEIKAHLLALKLYKDELRVVFSSQVRLVLAILKLQRYVLKPVILMLFPMLMGLAQMGIRYQWGPVPQGSRILLRAILPEHKGAPDVDTPSDLKLEVPDGVTVEVGPLRGPSDVAWRLRATQVGVHELTLRAGDQTFTKELVVGDELTRVSALRPGPEWVDQLLHPVETPIPADAPVRAISIDYPPIVSYVYGSNYWVIYFFVVSMAAALLLKPVFKVKF